MAKTEKPEFYCTAFRPFDFDKIIERLLARKQRYRREKVLFLAALGGWLIAPHQSTIRINLVRIQIRRALETAEKLIIATEPELRLCCEADVKEQVLGSDFLNEVYYPLGGVRFFRDNMNYYSVCREAREKHEKGIHSLNFTLDILRYISKHRKLQSQEPFTTLKECYDIIESINAAARQKDIPASPKLDRILNGKSLEVKISDYRGVAGLCYAASHVMVGKDKGGKDLSLLDHFLGRRTGLRTSDIYGFLPEWLARSAYVRDMILDSVDSPNLAEIANFESLKVDPIPIPDPKFEPWQKEIISRNLRSGI